MKRILSGLTVFLLVAVITLIPLEMADAHEPSPGMSLERIKSEIHSKGLSRIANNLLNTVKPSIRFTTRKTDEAAMAVGETKIGGRPDVPQNFIWPIWNRRSLSFVAQVNLHEIRRWDPEKILPETGMLYFFYDAVQEVWGFDPKERGGWRVIYYNGPLDNLARTVIPGDVPAEAQFKPCKVKCKSELSLPEWDSIYINELKLTPKESDRYVELYEELNQDSVIHKMLGHPNQVQNEMQLECQLVSNGLYCGDSTGYKDPRRKELENSAKEWRLLLQIDSDENAGMIWGDMGRIYFWIREEDLKAKKFGKTWMIFQCG